MAKESVVKPATKLHIGLPARVARWLPKRPWIHVEKSEQPWVQVDRKRVPVEIHPVAPSMSDEQLANFVQRIGSAKGRLSLAVSPRLRASARNVLETHGVAYADSQGHLHLTMPGLFVHLEVTPSRSTQQATAGVGPNGVRAIQALLELNEPIQVTGLAAQVNLSLAQTHTVLNVLEEAGLVRSTASGPARRRTVPDRTALLEWLAAQPAARRREPRIDAFVYARRPEDLWQSISQKLDEAGIAHALTGAAGAARYGVGPTAVPVTLLRITPDVSLEDAAKALGAETTERGANVRILRDTGLVGCVGAARRDGISVAPKPRVYLDALSEKRGEDLAQQFREVILGY